MENEILDDANHDRIRNVQYATFLDRLLAYLLDTLITIGPIFYLMYLGYTGKNIVWLLISSILGMLYKPIMEGVWGATLGKMIMKISVVDSDLDIVDIGQSLMKNAIYIISGVIGVLSQFWLVGTEKFQEAEGFLESLQAGEANPYGIVSMIWTVVIIISCFSMLASSLKQTLHDRLANTYCVKNSTFDE